MAFAIMRAKKLKTMGSVASSLQHCFRERETPNADQERTPENEHLVSQSTDEAMGKIRNLLPEKRRKDAVLIVEYVMTASPEWWEKASKVDQREFFDQSMKWIGEKYGVENVATASIHRDELTPHMSVFVVPKTADGRLSAKEFIGNKVKMSKDQTTFADQVKHLGLERGLEGSIATHQRVKSHYAAIQKGIRTIPQICVKELKPQKLKGDTLAEKLIGVKETDKGIANRLNAKITAAVSPIAAEASVSAQETRRRKDIESIAVSLRNENKAVRRTLEGLSKEQMSKVRDLIQGFRDENKLAKNKQRENVRTKTHGKNIRRGLSR